MDTLACGWAKPYIYASFPRAGGGGIDALRLMGTPLASWHCAVEARIFIEKGLTDPARRATIGDDLAKRSMAVLAARTRFMLDLNMRAPWMDSRLFLCAHWPESDLRLFDTAAEVADKLAQK